MYPGDGGAITGKIRQSALHKVQGKKPDEPVSFHLRLEPLTEQAQKTLEKLGATYVYRGGMVGAVTLPAGNLEALAEIANVIEIR